MNATFPFQDQLASTWDQAQSYLRQGLELLGSSIARGYHTQHNANDTHGAVTADSIMSTAGYLERGLTLPLGEWQDLTLAASDVSSDTGTFALNLSNYFLRWMRVGKSVTINIAIFNNATITGTPQLLFIKLPIYLQGKQSIATQADDDRFFNSAAITSQGVASLYLSAGTAVPIRGFTYLALRLDTGLWAASGAFGAHGQLTYELR